MFELNQAFVVSSKRELREVIAEPPEFLQLKVFPQITDEARDFIHEAPLVMLCTQDANGQMDVSPKGDAPGFVMVADATTLLIPDRPGNRLAYGFNNLLESPQLSLIFIRPGMRETLRVNGTGLISRDPELCEQLSAGGKAALLVTAVRVEECFFHCGKALIRSKLWQPDSWLDAASVSFGKQMAGRMELDAAAKEQTIGQIDDAVEQDYRDNLY